MEWTKKNINYRRPEWTKDWGYTISRDGYYGVMVSLQSQWSLKIVHTDKTYKDNDGLDKWVIFETPQLADRWARQVMYGK